MPPLRYREAINNADERIGLMIIPVPILSPVAFTSLTTAPPSCLSERGDCRRPELRRSSGEPGTGRRRGVYRVLPQLRGGVHEPAQHPRRPEGVPGTEGAALRAHRPGQVRRRVGGWFEAGRMFFG